MRPSESRLKRVAAAATTSAAADKELDEVDEATVPVVVVHRATSREGMPSMSGRRKEDGKLQEHKRGTPQKRIKAPVCLSVKWPCFWDIRAPA